jgi:hypothetical protein
MSDKFELTGIVPATPKAIGDVWTSGRGHTAMTGSKAGISARVGGTLTAVDSIRVGRALQLFEPERHLCAPAVPPRAITLWTAWGGYVAGANLPSSGGAGPPSDEAVQAFGCGTTRI